MKISCSTLINFTLMVVLLSSLFFVGITASVSTRGAGEYDPWCDLDDDGDIDIYDIVDIAGRYGTTGENITKASIEYDSGWIDITDKAGQYFDVAHNLNSTDIIVDIQGKTTADGGVHQRHLGGTGYTPGWNRTYGGSNNDGASSVVQTVDGGYAIAGYTYSFGAGDRDFWLIKTDVNGNVQWNRTYGGASAEHAYFVVQTSDGGYALAGFTESFGAGGIDIWLVKTDSNGHMEWNKTYGGTSYDGASSVVQTVDGGYAIAGWTESFGAGGYDLWLIKTDATGNMQWNKTYGGTYNDGGNSLVQTVDGGYAMAGSTYSYGAGDQDMWLVKTDEAGIMEWDETYGVAWGETSYSLVQTVDGGYALAGTRHFGNPNAHSMWLVRTDETGNMLWNQTYGGPNNDWALSLIQTSDGGYTLAGFTNSFGAGDHDVWLVRVDASGNMEWNKTYGGAGCDDGNPLVSTADGGYAIAGITSSSGAGGQDFWLIKTDAAGNAQSGFKYGLAWTDSTADTITLYRGATDAYWNYVRVRIWKIKENP